MEGGAEEKSCDTPHQNGGSSDAEQKDSKLDSSLELKEVKVMEKTDDSEPILVDDEEPPNYNSIIPNEETTPETSEDGSRQITNNFENVRKTLLGFVIVVGIAVSWVGSTQFSQSTYSETFNAPYFNVWFGTLWMFICYPFYVAGSWIFKKESRSYSGTVDLYKHSERVFGRKGLTIKNYFRLVAPFALCWMVTNYMYVYALGRIAAADVTALFSSNTAFIYIFSWIWLHERIVLLPARGLSVILSIAGIVLISYADGFQGTTAIGIALSIGSAIGSAIYKVLFKRYIGDATSGQVSLFLSLLALFDLVFLWPVLLTVYYTGFEQWDWNNMPWNYLCGSSALSVVFNFLINFGIAVTFPLFIALGTVVGIPLNAVVDLIFRGRGFGSWKIGGTILIVFGFLIMLMPERWQEKAYCCKSRRSVTLNGTEEAANGGIDNPTVESEASKKENMNGTV
ncbi:putative thiamine transporter SLC35F3 isoform X1 [Lytechinus variegatus]|uniref:putative thiamine transporter SLC35F3 isoform X1 n=2 Tax=Lytechinus variegatus TaxID=7654 RepID=UPI001BB17714|nr:putative thiamine transporter SLC35F3 isoform X1 [Lytechinus variegatus]